MVGAAIGALTVMTVIGGFLIIGSPSHIRDLRLDQQRTSDLQSIQYSISNYWQQKRVLPKTLGDLNDPLVGVTVPSDPLTKQPYEYKVESKENTFSICATFATPSEDMSGKGSYADVSMPYPSMDGTFDHAAGRTCFTRTIDPDKFPALQGVKPL